MYDNGTKQSARCWCWNQVCQRLPKGSTVMVLIGDTDFELQEANRRQMRVVGIDRRDDSVALFRDSGGIAIKDDFIEQMKNVKPDAIIFDGVSGMTKYAIQLIAAACRHTKVVVWNGLRGRDPMGKDWQKEFANFEINVYRKGRREAARQAGIHRAMLLYSFYFYEELKLIQDVCEVDYPEETVTDIGRFLWMVHKYKDFVMSENKPEFMSYRSKDSGQYFDTGAWTTMLPVEMYRESQYGSLSSRRKSAAAKALLTRSRKR